MFQLIKEIYDLTDFLTPRTDGITAYGLRQIFINPFIKGRSLTKRKHLTLILRGYCEGKLSHWFNWTRLSLALSSG